MGVRDNLRAKRTTHRLVPYTFAGESVFIRALSERERHAYSRHIDSVSKAMAEAKLSNTDYDGDGVVAPLLARCLVDEHDQPLFDTPSELLDFESGDIVDAYEACIDVLGINKESVDAKKNNSPQTVDSSSDSVSPPIQDGT